MATTTKNDSQTTVQIWVPARSAPTTTRTSLPDDANANYDHDAGALSKYRGIPMGAIGTAIGIIMSIYSVAYAAMGLSASAAFIVGVLIGVGLRIVLIPLEPAKIQKKPAPPQT